MSFAQKSSLLDTPAGLTPVESLWFEDGNLILRAEDSLFRIYSGILSARSSVFRDMFAFPPPAEGNAKMDECPIVEVYDSAEDMTYFLQAILDSRYSFVHDNLPCLILPPSYFEPPPSATHLPVIAGVLRLSTKYDVQYLRIRAMQHLLTTYPTTLADWKERDTKRTVPAIDNTPFAVLLLAREFDLPWLLPSVMYCICSHPIEKTLDGVSWHGSHLDLPWNDKRLCLIGRSNLLKQQNKDAVDMAKVPGDEVECQGSSCAATRIKSAEILCDWGVAGILDFAEDNVALFDSGLCKPCQSAFTGQCALASENMWQAMPGMFELPSWDELERQRLLALE